GSGARAPAAAPARAPAAASAPAGRVTVSRLRRPSKATVAVNVGPGGDPVDARNPAIPPVPSPRPHTTAAPTGANGNPGARPRPGSASLATTRAWSTAPVRRKPSATRSPVSIPHDPSAT